jgi:predicted site-specific integrase-resolvase
MSRPLTFELGTAITITTVLSANDPTSVKITIKDQSNITKVDAVSMVSSSNNVYTYVYQSATTNSDGVYKVIVDAVYSSGGNLYTSRAISDFTLIDTDE